MEIRWSVLLLALLAGCSRAGDQKEPAPVEVTVAAAADLKFAFDEIARDFERQHAGVKVKATYGSSGNFFTQLTNKAPFDMFLSADADYPRKLVELGHGDKEAPFDYAVGHIVIWTLKTSPLDVAGRGADCLLDPGVKKIAIANPRFAPYGRAAEMALKKWELYEKVKDKLVLGDNIAQAAQFVESGAADIGILALALAKAPALQEKGKYWEAPPEATSALVQTGVILSWAKDRQAADKLKQFLLGPDAKNILARYGFSFPGK